MISFVRLVVINKYWCTVRTDTISDINRLFEHQYSFGSRYILEVKAAGSLYKLDLGRLILNEPLLPADDITELVSRITPEMLYAYQSTDISLSHLIRTFNHKDLPTQVSISPCNATTGEESSTTYDPSFPDLIIKCEGYDLTKVLPIIDGKILRSEWSDGKIVVRDQVKLARTTKAIHFMSFAKANFELRSVVEMAQMDWLVPPDYTPILFIDGAMFGPEDVLIYHFNQFNRKLIIRSDHIDRSYAQAGYDTAADMLNDPSTFIMLVNGSFIIRDVAHIPMHGSERTAHMYFDETPSDPIDYICIDRVTRRVLDKTMISSRFTDVRNMTLDDEHHIYVDTADHDRLRMIQLIVR